MLSKLRGSSSISDVSKLLENYLSDEESIIASFKIWRDEVVVTNYGIYHVDAQGMSGKKKNINYVPIKWIEGFNFEGATKLSWDTELKIFVKRIENSSKKDDTIVIKSKKSDQEAVIDLMKIIKDLINS